MALSGRRLVGCDGAVGTGFTGTEGRKIMPRAYLGRCLDGLCAVRAVAQDYRQLFSSQSLPPP